MIRVLLCDDHALIRRGMRDTLVDAGDIEVLGEVGDYGALRDQLRSGPRCDVLLLDISVPVSAENSNDYPILHLIPKLMQLYPHMNILVISMFAERGLIRGTMEAGANGYILKDDRSTLVDLANVVLTIAGGGIHLSQKAHQLFLSDQLNRTGNTLSLRQLEALSLCAAFPDALTTELSQEMAVANSTFRNLLSGAYIKLNVRTRTAAISKARSLGIITPFAPPTPSAD